MDEDQCAACASGDEIGPDDGLADARRSHEHAGVMREKGTHRLLLGRRQSSLESKFEPDASGTLVFDGESDSVIAEQFLELETAASGQRNVLWQVLRAVDHPRRHRRGKTHALLLVELGVLERGESLDVVQQW